LGCTFLVTDRLWARIWTTKSWGFIVNTDEVVEWHRNHTET
jgi:hypothetical protein